MPATSHGNRRKDGPRSLDQPAPGLRFVSFLEEGIEGAAQDSQGGSKKKVLDAQMFGQRSRVLLGSGAAGAERSLVKEGFAL